MLCFTNQVSGHLSFPTSGRDSLISASKSPRSTDLVCSFPDGLSASAGSGGTQLSGGQRQRIAMVRALVRNHKIILLEEVTSALDTESEKSIQGALARAAKDSERNTLAVARRLSTIRDADVICIFHKRKVEEMGTHEELAALGGIYRKMCEAQALDQVLSVTWVLGTGIYRMGGKT